MSSPSKRHPPHLELTEIHDSDSDFCCASYRNVFFVLWRKATRLDAAQSILHHGRIHAARNLAGMVVFTIVEPGVPLPDQDVRAVIAQ